MVKFITGHAKEENFACYNHLFEDIRRNLESQETLLIGLTCVAGGATGSPAPVSPSRG